LARRSGSVDEGFDYASKTSRRRLQRLVLRFAFFAFAFFAFAFFAMLPS
jgi:hypothetical protein